MPDTTIQNRELSDSAESETEQSFRARFWRWLPEQVDKRIRVFAWLSFLAEVTIIATGGAVRLTGSGLGCSDWPLCTPESLVPIYEVQGIHGLIEFGNRLMTSVVGLLALAVLILVWRMRRERRDLFGLATAVVVGVIAQAVVGGITVWTGLNPFVVGFHYIASVVLVCLTAAFIVRMKVVPVPRADRREPLVPRWYAALAYFTAVPLMATMIAGVLTTGSGPHSGDAEVVRQGFDASILAHFHSWPGYVLVGCLLILAGAAWWIKMPFRVVTLWLLIIVAVQIAVGVFQARTALPPIPVGIHMVLASLAAAGYVVLILRIRMHSAAHTK